MFVLLVYVAVFDFYPVFCTESLPEQIMSGHSSLLLQNEPVFGNFGNGPLTVISLPADAANMITDARVLTADFQPSEILHRHDTINHLSSILEPVLAGERVDGAFLYGPTGTGKTCTARFLLNRLAHESGDVQTGYVDCFSNHSRAAVLQRIVDELWGDLTAVKRSTPADEVSQAIREALDGPAVLILDEADQISNDAVLYDLYRQRQICTLLVANDDEQMLSTTDPRVDSRFVTFPRIEFEPYSVGELVSILEKRATAGLEPDAIDTEGYEAIARVADGDARVAIGVLRAAANEGQRRGADMIDADLVADVVPDARQKIAGATISKFNAHQRVVLEVLSEGGKMRMPEIKSEYRDRVDDPRADRTLRNYMRKLTHYDLADYSGTNSGRRYWATVDLEEYDLFA